VKITNEFTVHTSIDQAWAVLTDLAGIAPCLPGAQLTGVDGDVYRGKVKVKVGPVISEFAGTARFVERDDAGHRAVIDAKGRDPRSAGNAAALITAELRPEGDATVVTVDTDLKISGKLAQFGSGMIKEVSGKLLGQFVESLEAKIGSSAAAPGSSAAAPGSSAAASASATAPGAAAAAPGAFATAPGAAATAPGTDRTGGESTIPAVDAPAIKPADAAFETGRPPVPATVGTGGRSAAVRADTPASSADEPAPLDLMDPAGGSLRKRLIPLAAGIAVVLTAVVIWRRSRR
jgi:uncharacterized protein